MAIQSPNDVLTLNAYIERNLLNTLEEHGIHQ